LFCSACGTRNDDNARFCLKCGRQLNSGPGTTSSSSGPAEIVESLAEALPTPPLTAPALPAVPSIPEMPAIPVTLPRQVVIGMPKRESPIAMIAGVLVAIAAIAGIAYGIVQATGDFDTDSLPIIGKTRDGGKGNGSQILVSLTSVCKDTQGRDCNLIWDITGMKVDAAGLRLEFELRATGQASCAVAILADQAIIAAAESSGRPGPFVEGARGRLYLLRNSEGITQTGGNLDCDKSQRGAWTFVATTGESFVKLRYPGIPPARFDFEANTGRPLAANDVLSVIPVQQTTCRTTQGQACTGLWEVGPYGLAGDGTPIIYFAVRFEGPTGCQVTWQSDLAGSQALIAAGQRGIGLELAGNTGFLPLTGGGGTSLANAPLPCGEVLAGFWRFAGGAVTSNVNLVYPDFPVVQVPIKP
jgi:hypothetical protein